MFNKMKGYRVERKIKLLLANNGWKVIRAGGSLGEADLIAFKHGNCAFFQIKSTNKKNFYYYGYDKKEFEDFPFFLVVDFGRNVIRITEPMAKVSPNDGQDFADFLSRLKNPGKNSFQ